MGSMKQLMAAVAVVLWLWTVAVEAEYLKYKDPKQPLKVRIKDLMSRMTLEEKIGQITQIEREVSSADVVNKYFIGMSAELLFFMIFFVSVEFHGRVRCFFS